MTDRWAMVKLAGTLVFTEPRQAGLHLFDLLRARLMRGETTTATAIQSGALIASVLMKEKQ